MRTPGALPHPHLLQQLGHGHGGDGGHCDVLEDGLCGGRQRGLALGQRLDYGLPHVPAGVPAHGQQGHHVLVPEGAQTIRHSFYPSCNGGKRQSPDHLGGGVSDLMSGYLETSVETSRQRREGSVSLKTSAMAAMLSQSRSVSSP